MNATRSPRKPALTSASFEIPPRVVAAPVTPEFCRLPKSGDHCPHTGLTRSFLNSLILPSRANCGHPPVKSISLREPGRKKGCRLIVYSSLIEYLRQHEQGPAEAMESAGAA